MDSIVNEDNGSVLDVELCWKFIEDFGIGIYRTNPEGVILTANNVLSSILGLNSPEEIYSDSTLKETFPPSLHNKRSRELLERNGKIVGMETVWKHRNGTRIYLRENVKTVRDRTGKIIFYEGTVENIAEKKNSAENLRKLSQAVEQSPVSIIVTDLSGKIEYVNPRACLTSGYSFRELIGANPRILKSGHTADLEYSILWRKITSGHVWKGVFHNRKKSGELYWESASVAPVFDPDGLITHFVAVKEDITEKKGYEESLVKSENKYRILADELGRINATKDKLFSVIAHDLRGPIGNFKNVLDIFSETGDNEHIIREMILKELRKESDNIYEILENLLFWSKAQQNSTIVNPVKVDLFEIVSEMIRLYVSRAQVKQITLRNLIDREVNITCDKEHLALILKNLISNAIKFTTLNGRVEISAVEHENFIYINVEDNGLGISDDVLKNLFNQSDFFRTYGTDGEKGRGLGLIICKYYTELNNGNIYVKSNTGEGSKFTVAFPLYKSL